MNTTLRPAWLSLDGQRWLFDEKTWELGDWFVIKNATGLGRVSFLNGVLDEDPAALQALIWFLRRKDEPALRLEEVQFRPAVLEWDAVEDEPDAVPPSVEVVEPPTTSSNDGTSTSTSSPDGAASLPVMSTP